MQVQRGPSSSGPSKAATAVTNVRYCLTAPYKVSAGLSGMVRPAKGPDEEADLCAARVRRLQPRRLLTRSVGIFRSTTSFTIYVTRSFKCHKACLLSATILHHAILLQGIRLKPVLLEDAARRALRFEKSVPRVRHACMLQVNRFYRVVPGRPILTAPQSGSWYTFTGWYQATSIPSSYIAYSMDDLHHHRLCPS